MGDASKFYSYGCYNSNVGLKSLAKKIVYEDELSLTYDDNGTYTLSVEDTVIGTITVVPCVEDATYNSDDNTLVLTITTTDGTKEITVDMSDLASTYSAGDGLSLSDNTFSVTIDENSDSYLTLTSDGLLLTGIKEAIDTLQANIDAEASARETADSEIDAKITTVADNLSTLNANVLEISNTLTTAVENLSASDESLQTQITSNDEDIAALQEVVSSLGASDSTLTTYTAGTGISIDNDTISIDEEYTATVEQVETVTELISNNAVTGDDVDAYILEVENETNYGIAKAMGVE